MSVREKSIGLFLDGEPKGGGTFQYNLSMLKALVSLDAREFRVIIYFRDKGWASEVPVHLESVYISERFYVRYIRFLLSKVDRSRKLLQLTSKYFDTSVRALNSSGCDVVIFPSQDAISYEVDVESLSTVHDLMHRYEPDFDEYKGQEYINRENHYRAMCRKVSGVLVDSNLGKKHVCDSYNIDPNRVFVLPFVPPSYIFKGDHVDVFRKYNLPKQYVFYPAQFWEHKNHVNLLLAIRILKDEYKYLITLVLVGSKKNYFDTVVNTISKLEIEAEVKILGYVDNADIVALYRNALVTTFVSLIGPTNIPPMEALALGSPLVCSNAYAMPEQVGDGGILVDPKSPVEIASAIYKIASDEPFRQGLIRKGYDVIGRYGQADFDKTLLKIINSF